METQLKAFYRTPQGVKFVNLFGYATKGVPSLEINGVGRLSKNIKEKIIYLTRIRKLAIPLRRFVVCVDINELQDQSIESLRWLEFPLLLMYWHLSGLIPIAKLDNCLCSGWLNANGEIHHMYPPRNLGDLMKRSFNLNEINSLKFLSFSNGGTSQIDMIDSKLLLEHIPNLVFKYDMNQMDRSSAIPTNSFIA